MSALENDPEFRAKLDKADETDIRVRNGWMKQWNVIKLWGQKITEKKNPSKVLDPKSALAYRRAERNLVIITCLRRVQQAEEQQPMCSRPSSISDYECAIIYRCLQLLQSTNCK